MAEKLDQLRKFFNPGDKIVKEGSGDYDLYLLLKGQAEVYAKGKKVATINSSKGDQFIGELSAILQEKRTATVVAKTPCAVLAIPHVSLEKAFRLSPSLAMKLIKTLANRVKETTELVKTAGKGEGEGGGITSVHIKGYVRGVLHMLDKLAGSSEDAGFKSLKEYVTNTNPWGVRESEATGIFKGKIKDAEFKKRIGLE